MLRPHVACLAAETVMEPAACVLPYLPVSLTLASRVESATAFTCVPVLLCNHVAFSALLTFRRCATIRR